MEMGFSAAELRMCKTIREKDSRLRALLRERRLSGVVDPLDWLGYLSAASRPRKRPFAIRWRSARWR
jgi:hypothetical protein